MMSMTTEATIAIPDRESFAGMDTAELHELKRALTTRRQVCVDNLKAIDVQLCSRDRRDPETGERLAYDLYWQWRSSAMTAKRHMERELGQLKPVLQGLNAELSERAVGHSTVDRIERKLDLLLAHFGISS